MMDKHGIGQIGNGAYRLSANFRFRVGLSQLQKLFDRRGLPAARQNPNCVESAPYSQTLLSQGCSHPRIPISPLTLDRPLGIPPFEMTVGIELRQPVVRLSAGGTRGLTRLVLGPVSDISDVVNTAPAALGPLSVGIVGHHERAVALHDKIGRLKAVRIVSRAAGKLWISGLLKAASAGPQRITHDRLAPLAKQQVATILLGELPLQVASATRRGPQAQIGQRRQRFAGMILI